MRNDGTFVERQQPVRAAVRHDAAQCADDAGGGAATGSIFLNKGLQTLQFYNVAVDPRAIRCTG